MFMLSACSSRMAAEGRMEDLSARTYPRDLLRAFGGATHGKEPTIPITIPIPIPIPIPVGEGEMGGIELNLGLSLGGCFGVEPGSGADARLVRSSSLAAFSILPFGEYEVPAVNGALARTCSLPAEADEEHRKRKAMQSLKRLEAKRKRLERRNSRVGSDEDVVSGHGSVETKPATNGLINGQSSSSYHGSPKCESRISRQSSSGLSSIDSQALQGLTITTDSKGLSIKPPLPEHDNHKADTNPAAATMPRTLSYAAEENGLTLKADQKANMFVGEADQDMMEEMPSVSTRGDGPNGKKIEGFLYKYKKGEAVRIVCICHGKFHTPAEFVKHAGGSDVAHPLKHIVVNPLPSPGYQ